jgi:hypothetical protein
MIYYDPMKLCIGILTALSIILIGLSYDVSAHPGGTDINGGHSCWTDCSSWGLNYGEYHYHDGGYIEPDYYTQGGENGTEYVDENSSFIISRAESYGSEKGTSDGESGDPEDDSPDADDFCSDVNFESDTSPQDYYDGFMDTYSDGCRELYDEYYSKAYDTAYLTGTEKYQALIASQEESDSETSTTTDNSSDWSGLLWLGAIMTPFIVIGNWDSIKKWWKDS